MINPGTGERFILNRFKYKFLNKKVHFTSNKRYSDIKLILILCKELQYKTAITSIYFVILHRKDISYSL